MIILGAGFTGLLAGCINRNAMIYEEKTEEECRKKHQAVLRMRSNKIAEYFGINFKKVKVHKSIWYKGRNVSPTPDMIHRYSKKVIGSISNRSIENISTEIRYIPPENFYDLLLEKSCTVMYDIDQKKLLSDNPKYGPPLNIGSGGVKIINTLSLVEILKLPFIHSTAHGSLNFMYNPIYVTKLKIKNCDSYATVYYPDRDDSVYRATLNGDILIVESINPLSKNLIELCSVSASFGLSEDDIIKWILINFEQKIGKINKIDNKIRSKLILDLTLNHNIYSLGRVATWRPSVMLDDAFDDIFVIRRLMEHGEYASVLYQQDLEK